MKLFSLVFLATLFLTIGVSCQPQQQSTGQMIRQILNEKLHKLMEKANELLIKLQTQNQIENAKQLQKAMQNANSIFYDFASMNLDQEFNFSVKALMERLKKAEQRLQGLIDKLSHNKNKQ